MDSPGKQIALLFLIGFFVTLSSAANVTCPSGPLNETVICANITGSVNDSSLCSSNFPQYACANSSFLATLSEEILVNISRCYTNITIQSLDPAYLSFFLSKLDTNKINATYDKLNSQFPSIGPEWRKYLLNGIWPLLIQNLNSTGPLQWIPRSLQPFFSLFNTDNVTCLQQKNVTCEIFQELVKTLDMEFFNMTDKNRQELYPALKSFLSNQKNVSGSACSQNINSSVWIKQNLGMFSQFANLSDFTALNPNFSALDALSFLTMQQIANFSIDFDPTNNSDAVTNILAVFNGSSLLDFLSLLNATAMSRNITTLRPPMAQALLNKTFETLKANITRFNSSDWTQLFQDKLYTILPQISPDQLSLIPTNITCDSYQAIVAGLDSKFPQMTTGTQNDVYKTLIQPYVKNKGPSCSLTPISSAFLKQNFGRFLTFATYSDIASSFGDKFNALDVLPSLTTSQVVDFALNTTIKTPTANSIVGNLQNVTDVYNFLSVLNAALSSKNQTSVDPVLSKALLAKTFQVVQSNFSTFTNVNWTELFQDKLRAVLPAISPDQLNLLPKNLACDSFQTIVKSLDSNFSQMSTETQKSVYNLVIKPYLKPKGNSKVIVCYNQSDANSSAWLVTNMASFMSFTSEEDLTKFADDTTLGIFASDPSSVKLASKLNFPQKTAIYYTTLLTSNANFNLSSLPEAFLCFLQPQALKNLNENNILDFTNKINKQCLNTTQGQGDSKPTPEQLQVAISLVSKLTNFSSANVINLGQSAVGLSPRQIDKISAKDLQDSASSLANVNGWNAGQTRYIMNKLLQSNYPIDNLTNLGSLVTGLPSDKLLTLDPKNVVNAVKDAQFASKLSSAPPALQNAVVKQIITADPSVSNIVKNVPGNLVSFIPSSKLVFKSEKPVLQDVNSKSWTPNQAAMFFDDVLSNSTNYTAISASVLQGFTCSTPSKIDVNSLKTLAKAMKTQNTSLSEAQLTCLSRQVTKSGYPTDLDQYPTEVFLFLNASNYVNASITCKDFYAKVGAANISILKKGSETRNKLLPLALSCLNVTGSTLTDENIQVLGQLSCDLNSTFIESSAASGALLTSLTQCKSFTNDQQDSIRKVVSGSATLGSSSTWTSETLNSLGGIVPCLNQTFISSIPSVSFNSWMKSSIRSSAFSRDQFASFVKYRTSTRARRATCTMITADNVNDELLPLNYDATNLDACLDNDILVSYLNILSSMTFTTDQLQVLKNKLDALYPGGYPDSILLNLGAISSLCTSADIKKWNITSVDTLGSLLTAGPSDSVAQIIITQYGNSNGALNGSAINVIGSKYICLLNSDLLKLISPSAISDAQPLDVSACNQTVKDALYAKANTAYQDMASQTAAYYNLIKPYLGGAPTADLKTLAAKSPNMDISTFVALNPTSVLGLTVSDVKNLLGNNTADLLSQLSSPTVSQWIKIQKQSDLDTLGLGVTGGIREVATSTPTTIKTSTASASPGFLQSLSFVLVAVGITFLI